MTQSMTGYARVERVGEWGRVSWELRSVNHRYLDVQFRLPEEFRALEGELRQSAAAALSRGKVEATLRYQLSAEQNQSLELNLPRVQQLRAALDTLNAEFGPVSVPDPLRLLSFSGVMQESAPDFAPLVEAAQDLFSEALTAFTASRASEGERMAAFMRERCTALAELVAQVRARYPQVRDQWMDKIKTRCAELGVELDQQRLAQETILAAQRLDVEEEMSRLESHIVEVQKVLKRNEAVGRRLDFLMQEFNREANTTGSKSQDAEMTRCAVEMKVIIEQLREQVQNIE